MSVDHPQSAEVLAAVERYFDAGNPDPFAQLWVERYALAIDFLKLVDYDDGLARWTEDYFLGIGAFEGPPSPGVTLDDCKRWLRSSKVTFVDGMKRLRRACCLIPIAEARSSAELALDALTDLYRVPREEWIFVTDRANLDEWPSPLPRPPVWPPAAG